MFFWLRCLPLFFLVVQTSASIWPFSLLKQWVNLSGKFTCEGQAYEGVIVELWEKDRDFFGDDYQYLGSTESNEGGHFSVLTSTFELTAIEPFFQITHRCFNDSEEDLDCAKVFKFDVPEEAVARGDEPGPEFDMGTIELRNQDGMKFLHYDCSGRFQKSTQKITTAKTPTTDASPESFTEGSGFEP